MAPMSLKRSSPSQSDDDCIDEPETKRRRFEDILPNTPPPEEDVGPFFKNRPVFDDDLHQLLLRSIALTLEHVGFDAATPESLEAMCAEVETYATHFLSKVTSSMLNARRSLPTPLDFKYALEEFDLPIASIEPHLKPPIPRSRYLVQLEALPVEELPTSSAGILLEPELSGEPDKNEKAYIPKNFPSFPSKHTYKWTEKESARETNPRKIREEAAKAARQGEEALRRLTRVSKVGKEKDVKKVANKDPKSKERHEIWERTMDDLFLAKPLTGDGPGQESDQSMIVNANSPFFRKGVPAKRKPPLPVEI
ncbi:hypothetical protein NA56DRAFT_567975 [Hyaloscypha hepaticicola]|uniref:Transcription initiation factor TFIID subunit 8 n=1 Tax=Hyaloscypha hepaticicola TaxID=2082293 RepID=A0A2J6QBM4_9HELO|nr:hypothetical protein NA56DRAFT_567975 [Hyaloscypha hepaticicola]